MGSYETSNPYVACSSDSEEGFCPKADFSCKPINIARTCGSFSEEGGPCTGLANYPNVTISDYGSISGKEAMQKEILQRGPISCGIDANPLLNYESGVLTKKGEGIDHVISVVGWGEEDGQGYWHVRNSWRVLGRDGLHPRGLRRAECRGPVRVGGPESLHRGGVRQPGPLPRGRRQLRRQG